MATFFLIDEWSEQPWWNTGGTRDKKIYLNPEDGEIYYFKQSFKKGNRDYKYEFWSEIIAFEIGHHLGFDVLPYQIAKRGNVLGCISKTMVTTEEELVEGGKYLQAYDPTFNPEETDLRFKYDLQLITRSLRHYSLEKYLPNLIDTIVFDSLIGNSDRHQENWAVIMGHTQKTKAINDLEAELKDSSRKKFFRKFYEKILFSRGKMRSEITEIKLNIKRTSRFAPIYDSGCCFGRELSEVKIRQILNNKEQLEAYVERGKAEIHWEGKKISHFKLIENLLDTDEFKAPTLVSLKKISDKFSEDEIRTIIYHIDADLASSGIGKHLPEERKELIWELLALRRQKLQDIYHKHQ